jgi:hypothetical protein
LIFPDDLTGKSRSVTIPDRECKFQGIILLNNGESIMGWSLCMATERDAKTVTWLGRVFSYELLQDGCLQAFLTDEELEILARGWIDDPEEWTERDPGEIGDLLKRVRSLLRYRN